MAQAVGFTVISIRTFKILVCIDYLLLYNKAPQNLKQSI